MKLKLKSNIKMAISIIINIIAIILLMVVVIGLKQNAKLNTINDSLNSKIESQENIIDKLTHDNEILRSDIAKLQDNISRLKDINSQLQEDNKRLEEDNEVLELESKELLSEIEELLFEIENLEKKIKENNATSSHKDFKSYMSYKAITNKSSKQWKLQQQATTNEDGIRCIDGIPMVAVGTGWGLSVGDIALVTCENGNSFKVIIGDIKDDKHTDAENKTTIANGCRCEFIVEVSKISSSARRAGNMAVLDKYKGYVINIEKVN